MFIQCVEEKLMPLVYVLPQKLKLIRRTKAASLYLNKVSCMECESVVSPHSLNKICQRCFKVCCHKCFTAWTNTRVACEYAFPCLCKDKFDQNVDPISITEYRKNSPYLMNYLEDMKLNCPFSKECKERLAYLDFYRGHS